MEGTSRYYTVEKYARNARDGKNFIAVFGLRFFVFSRKNVRQGKNRSVTPRLSRHSYKRQTYLTVIISAANVLADLYDAICGSASTTQVNYLTPRWHIARQFLREALVFNIHRIDTFIFIHSALFSILLKLLFTFTPG